HVLVGGRVALAASAIVRTRPLVRAVAGETGHPACAFLEALRLHHSIWRADYFEFLISRRFVLVIEMDHVIAQRLAWIIREETSSGASHRERKWLRCGFQMALQAHFELARRRKLTGI